MIKLEDFLKNPDQAHLIDFIKRQLDNENSEQLIEIILILGYQAAKNEILDKLKSKLRPRRAVFSNDVSRCERKIRELIGDEVIFVEQISRSSIRIETLNDIYIGASASESSRGMKNHYIYIDESLDESYKEVIDKVLIPSCYLPYQLYPEGAEFDWKSHIEYFSFEDDLAQ
jgi:hypothetical protein